MLSWDLDNCGHSEKSKIKMFLCLRQVKDILNSDFVFRKQSDKSFCGINHLVFLGKIFTF